MWVAFDGFDVLEILRRTGLVSQYTTKLENGDEFIRYMHEMIDEFNKGSLFKVMSGFYGAMYVLEESAHGGIRPSVTSKATTAIPFRSATSRGISA